MKEIEVGAKAPAAKDNKAAALGPRGMIETKKRYFKENIL